MEYTYNAYRELIRLLKEHGYTICSYKNWESIEGKRVILRHDIDNDLSKAVELARIEKEEGVSSTWFVLLTSDFYNVFSKNSEEYLKEIISLGHTLGLHFDEKRYSEMNSSQNVVEKIQFEADVLSKAIGTDIYSVSMHMPSERTLQEDLKIPGMINSYGWIFFREFKYLSDSRRRWREPVIEIIKSEQYDKLHILTHAFWYNDEEKDIHDSVCDFINSANNYRYNWMSENIDNIDGVMKKSEVMGCEY